MVIWASAASSWQSRRGHPSPTVRQAQPSLTSLPAEHGERFLAAADHKVRNRKPASECPTHRADLVDTGVQRLRRCARCVLTLVVL